MTRERMAQLRGLAKTWLDRDASRPMATADALAAGSALNEALDTIAFTAADPGEREPLVTWDKRAADALAVEVEKLIERKVIDSRSPAADALLDYRDGKIQGPHLAPAAPPPAAGPRLNRAERETQAAAEMAVAALVLAHPPSQPEATACREDCPECGGNGVVPVPNEAGDQTVRWCPACNGTGLAPADGGAR